MPIHRIAVLMASFNRRDLTLGSLAALFNQSGTGDFDLEVFLVDDGCTDGTGDAVRSRFPQVRVLQGEGNLFWNGGMRVAFDAAMKNGFDAYILFNDDTILYDDAVERVVRCARTRIVSGKPAIVVGSTRSSANGMQSYGGFTVQKHGLSFWFEPVVPHESEPLPCDTMNGNFALIPAQVAGVVGNIEIRFRHQFGDLDYGLRAKQAGFDVVVAPGYVGECNQNPATGTWRDPDVRFARRWKSILSPKGLPVNDWVLFTWRHYGWRWLHYAISPYLKAAASSLLSANVKAERL